MIIGETNQALKYLFELFDEPCRYGIGHVRYINILTWLRGFQIKIVNFLKVK